MLVVLAIIASWLTPTKLSSWLSLAFALFVYGILPGYMILLFIPLKQIERIILGIGLSFAVIPVLLYTVDIFHTPLNKTTILILVALITIISWLYRKYWKIL